MSVKIITHIQFGPFQSGSTLVVSPSYAQTLVNRYGANVTIKTTYPGTYWYQDGAILHVYPQYNPPPVPVPTPVQGTINVRFISEIQDPVSGQVYSAGPLYRFTISGLQTLNSRVGGLVFSSDLAQNNPIPATQLRYYTGRTIYVDQAIYAFRAPGPVVYDDNGNSDNNGIINGLNANGNAMLPSFNAFKSA